jgi:hypothetical protein
LRTIVPIFSLFLFAEKYFLVFKFGEHLHSRKLFLRSGAEKNGWRKLIPWLKRGVFSLIRVETFKRLLKRLERLRTKVEEGRTVEIDLNRLD